MGKTALLRRFAATACDRPGDPRPPLAVEVDIADLRDGDDIGDAIGKAVEQGARGWADIAKAVGLDVGRLLRAGDIVAALAKRFVRHRASARPICLLADEVQTAGSNNAEALGRLHRGTMGLPILPVYAGLNDSADALRRCGISRLSRHAQINLQPLPPENAREAVCRMLDFYAVAGDRAVLDNWTETVARDSLGFPQHLNAGLAEAAGVLAENDGTATVEGLRTVRARAGAARAAYYQGRLNPEVRLYERALVALIAFVAGSDRPPSAGVLHDHAHELLQQDKRRGRKTPDAGAFLGALIHDGVLQENETMTGYAVPIPSMQTWILRDYAKRIGLDPPLRDDPAVSG